MEPSGCECYGSSAHIHTHTWLTKKKERRKALSLPRKPTTYHLHDELLSTECNIQWIIYELICNEQFSSQRKQKLAVQPSPGWRQGTGLCCSSGKKTFSSIDDELHAKKVWDKNPVPSKHQPGVPIFQHTLRPHLRTALAHAVIHPVPADR